MVMGSWGGVHTLQKYIQQNIFTSIGERADDDKFDLIV